MVRHFLITSLLVVLLMYVVPFTLLSGREGVYTFAFWTVTSALYLAYVFFSLRR